MSIGPYHLAYINIILSIMLGVGIYVYRYIYPKKKINLFFVLILISLLPVWSIFRSGTYESGDFNIHIYRIITFYTSLSEGNMMPSWAADLNATYGNPLFIFNYPLPYYLVSLFHFLGFSFITSMKIFLAGTFFFSGVFMYFAMKKIAKNEIAAFTTAVFYLFNPYHLSDLHFRATPGESMLFMLAPLLLYFVTSFLQEKKLKYLFLISLTTILLSLAHPMVSLTIHGLIIIFALTLQGIKNRLRLLAYIFVALAIGFIGSLYVWVPFLIFSKITYPDPAATSASMAFVPFKDIFYSPYAFGFLFQGHNGELPFPIGHPQLFVVLLGVILLAKSSYLKKLNLQYAIWLILLLVLIFFMHPISFFIWRYFPTTWLLESRLPFPIAICTTMIVGYVALFLSRKKTFRKWIYIFLIVTILSTILNWGHRRLIPSIQDTQLKAGVWKSSASYGLVWFIATKWQDKGYFDTLPKNHLEIIQGHAETKELSRNTTKHTYVINALTPITIKENTLWYPGWDLKSNNRTIQTYPGKGGIINAKLPAGLQYLELTYDDIPIMKTLKTISIGITTILLLALAGDLFVRRKNVLIK